MHYEGNIILYCRFAFVESTPIISLVIVLICRSLGIMALVKEGVVLFMHASFVQINSNFLLTIKTEPV